MNPEERELLERSLKLAEENNSLLRTINARGKRAAVYGFIKMAIVLLPFILGYFFLQPYINQAAEGYNQTKSLIDSLSESLSR